ncbi:MAG: hypothetical protein ACXWC0_28435, partial [Burkholderiales bacterium]
IKHAAAQRRTKRFQLGPTKRDLDDISRGLLGERGVDIEADDLSVADPLEDWPESAGDVCRWIEERCGGMNETTDS